MLTTSRPARHRPATKAARNSGVESRTSPPTRNLAPCGNRLPKAQPQASYIAGRNFGRFSTDPAGLVDAHKLIYPECPNPLPGQSPWRRPKPPDILRRSSGESRRIGGKGRRDQGLGIGTCAGWRSDSSNPYSPASNPCIPGPLHRPQHPPQWLLVRDLVAGPAENRNLELKA